MTLNLTYAFNVHVPAEQNRGGVSVIVPVYSYGSTYWCKWGFVKHLLLKEYSVDQSQDMAFGSVVAKYINVDFLEKHGELHSVVNAVKKHMRGDLALAQYTKTEPPIAIYLSGNAHIDAGYYCKWDQIIGSRGRGYALCSKIINGENHTVISCDQLVYSNEYPEITKTLNLLINAARNPVEVSYYTDIRGVTIYIDKSGAYYANHAQILCNTPFITRRGLIQNELVTIVTIDWLRLTNNVTWLVNEVDLLSNSTDPLDALFTACKYIPQTCSLYTNDCMGIYVLELTDIIKSRTFYKYAAADNMQSAVLSFMMSVHDRFPGRFYIDVVACEATDKANDIIKRVKLWVVQSNAGMNIDFFGDVCVIEPDLELFA